jgi:glycosyltransferase involved in cell wall biosynthesis
VHILFITDNFPPESNAPANRTYEHVKVWVDSGHKVTIITCAPNFPDGKVYPGYRNAWKFTEHISGIRIIRVKTYMTSNRGVLKRILDYASFGFMSAFVGLFIKKPDIVIGTSPQPFSVISAWFITRVRRKPFVFELRDLWPDSVMAVSAMKNGWMIKLFRKFIHYLYRKADLIISVTNSFKSRLIAHGISADKIKIIKNGINLDMVSAVVETVTDIRDKYNLPNNKFICGYIGTIGMAHSVDTILTAAEKCKQPSLHFLIMGSGTKADAIAQKAILFDNVTFMSSKTRSEALQILNAIDAAIVHLKDDPLFHDVIPSKIFEAMALSKPILMGVLGESRDMVINQAKAGLPFEPENPEALCEAAQQLFEQAEVYKRLAENGKAYVLNNFTRQKLAASMLHELLNIYD